MERYIGKQEHMLHVTRVTHIQCPISQYRFTRYGYSLCHLIKYKKKEIYNGQSLTTKGCCIKLKIYNFVTRVTQK